MRDDIMPCKCGSRRVTVYSPLANKHLAIITCEECCKTAHGEGIDNAISAWNDSVSNAESYEQVLEDMTQWYCDYVCESHECDVRDRCDIAPFMARADSVVSEGVIVVRSDGVSGTCQCSECKMHVDPFDKYCRHCGARMTETRYERLGE